MWWHKTQKVIVNLLAVWGLLTLLPALYLMFVALYPADVTLWVTEQLESRRKQVEPDLRWMRSDVQQLEEKRNDRSDSSVLDRLATVRRLKERARRAEEALEEMQRQILRLPGTLPEHILYKRCMEGSARELNDLQHRLKELELELRQNVK